MNRTDTFLSCLKNWDETTENKTITLESLNFHLGYILGIRGNLSPTLEDIYKRIVYLTKEERIQEKFLIYSLISDVDFLLESDINFLGEALLNNIVLEEYHEKEYGAVPEHITNARERLRSKIYISQSENQLDNWREIKNTHFTLSNERTWEYEDFPNTNCIIKTNQ